MAVVSGTSQVADSSRPEGRSCPSALGSSQVITLQVTQHSFVLLVLGMNVSRFAEYGQKTPVLTAGHPGEVAAHHRRKWGREDLHPASCGWPVVLRLGVHPQVCSHQTTPRPPLHAPVHDAAALVHRAPAWILQGCEAGGWSVCRTAAGTQQRPAWPEQGTTSHGGSIQCAHRPERRGCSRSDATAGGLAAC